MRTHDPRSPYGMEKFVELGMGVAIAQEMTRALTAAMQQANVGPNAIPAWGTPPSPQAPPPLAVYHLALDGRPVGPLTLAEISEKLRSGHAQLDTLAWRPGFAAWEPLRAIPELASVLIHLPPPIPGAP